MFEYKIETMISFTDKIEIQTFLNKQGARKWELVAILPNKTTKCHAVLVMLDLYYFKRKKVTKPSRKRV